MNKNNLLTIGELAKLSKVSVQAIRHYEKIGLLKPTFVDPHTNFRYYSLQYPELLDYVILALEFEIPLKTLRDYFKRGDVIDLLSLTTYAKEQAKEKISKLQQGFEALCKIEKAIKNQELFPIEKIYEQPFPNQRFISASVDDTCVSKLKCLQLYQTLQYDIEEVPVFGTMIKKTKDKTEIFALVELSIHSSDANLMIPAGIWQCYKSYDASINHVHDIFTDSLTLDDDFIAIEGEVISSQIHIDRPLYELRVIKR